MTLIPQNYRERDYGCSINRVSMNYKRLANWGPEANPQVLGGDKVGNIDSGGFRTCPWSTENISWALWWGVTAMKEHPSGPHTHSPSPARLLSESSGITYILIIASPSGHLTSSHCAPQIRPVNFSRKDICCRGDTSLEIFPR